MSQVAIVEDDHECAAACEAELGPAGWQCVHFDCVSAALTALHHPRFPDFVLMDLNLPGEDAFAGIAAIKARRPNIEIVALTGRSEDGFLFPALKAGASGYVLKNDAVGRLTQVLGQVKAGEVPISPSIARRVLASFRMHDEFVSPRASLELGVSAAAPNAELTGRELDVLGMLSRGLSYEECGATLGISLDTVRSHVRNTYRKLHAASKAEAVAIAMRSGWLT